MRAFYTKRFLDHYAAAPPRIQKAVDRRAVLLLQNLRHPSLHAKKHDEAQGIWQARVNGGVAPVFHHRRRPLPPPRPHPASEIIDYILAFSGKPSALDSGGVI